MTSSVERPHWLRHPLAPLLMPAASFIVVGLVIWWALHTPGDGYWAKRSQLCDRFVALLVNSKDLVEVQRAGFLVHELDCRITPRVE